MKMPVLNDVSLTLSTAEVMRRAGVKEGSILTKKLEALKEKLLDKIADNDLLEPSIAYEIYPIIEINEHQTRLQGGVVLEGPLIPSVFSKAAELAVVICTVGLKLEQEVSLYFERKERLEGLLLDGIGTSAMDSLAQKVCRFMSRMALKQGRQASSSLSPGMPGFPLSEQWHLFELAPAGEIGVNLTPSGMMVPRKSLSMVIGIGPEMNTWTQAEVCFRCTLNKTCAYKYKGTLGPVQRQKQAERDGIHN
jgi:hypothetical protein